MIKKDEIKLEFVKLSDKRYQEIRDRHYVVNNGCHGQQLHFLIWYLDEIVGIISGASSVYAVSARDKFFKIPKDKKEKQKLYLPSIINNVVFRLEKHIPNLATAVLSKWRKISIVLWNTLYGVDVIGFETFVVEEDFRKGALYKADNWTLVGETAGSTKKHNGLKNKSERVSTDKKLIYCIWNKKNKIPTKYYVSSWRAETEIEKQRARKLKKIRSGLFGCKF